MLYGDYERQVLAVYDPTSSSLYTQIQGIESPELLPLLEAVPADSPFAQRAESLAAALRRFQPLPPERVPQRSLLREFLGGGVV